MTRCVRLLNEIVMNFIQNEHFFSVDVYMNESNCSIILSVVINDIAPYSLINR